MSKKLWIGLFFQVPFCCWGYPQTVHNPEISYNVRLLSYSLPKQQPELHMIDLPRLKETWENILGFMSHCLASPGGYCHEKWWRQTHHPCTYYGQGLLPSQTWSDYFFIVFFAIGNLLAQMLFITVYHTCNRRIIIGYRRILSTMGADI